MFEKVFEKAEQAITRLNQVLTMFDQDFTRLKGTYESELNKFQDQAMKNIDEAKKGLDDVFTEVGQNAQTIGEVMAKDVLDKMTAATDRHIAQMRLAIQEAAEASEKQVREDIDKMFEKDIEHIFLKYRDRLTPVVFKSLLRYVFTFGRKK